MNLQNFTMNTPDPEYRRVIRHEAGHTLGFPHQHMRWALVNRIDPAKAYEYFARTIGDVLRFAATGGYLPPQSNSSASSPMASWEPTGPY